jgi:PAS domain S-box-containing protein
MRTFISLAISINDLKSFWVFGMTEKKLNVLIAEPDELASEVMAEVIKAEGHQCVVVNSSEDAYKALTKPFDVLFLHRGIDKINIESIARYARGISYIPVIILISSQSPIVAEVDRLKIDADAVIFKPLEMPDIINVLNISKKSHKNFSEIDEPVRLLVASEDSTIKNDLKSVLSIYRIDDASSSDMALKMAGDTRYDIIICDSFSGGMNSIQLVQSAKNINPFLWSIIISDNMKLDIAIVALKEGVNDIIEKPIKPSAVIQAIEKARHTVKLENDKRRLLFDLQYKTKRLEESNAKLHISEKLVLELHHQTLQQLDELTKFKKIIEFSGDAIYVIDVDTFLFISANARATQMLGYTNEEFLKIGPSEIDPTYPIQTVAEKKDFVAYLTKHNKPLIFDTHNVHKNGQKIPVEISSILQEIDSKRYLLAIVRDTTDRNEKEKEVKKLSHIVEQNPISVLITNLKGVIEYANPSFYNTFDLEAAEVINRPVDLLFQKMNYLNTFHEILSSVFAGGIWQGQTFCVNKQNKKIWLRVIISPVKNEFNEIANFVILQEDVSQKVLDAERQKEQEKHMIESSRLATSVLWWQVLGTR